MLFNPPFNNPNIMHPRGPDRNPLPGTLLFTFKLLKQTEAHFAIKFSCVLNRPLQFICRRCSWCTIWSIWSDRSIQQFTKSTRPQPRSFATAWLRRYVYVKKIKYQHVLFSAVEMKISFYFAIPHIHTHKHMIMMMQSTECGFLRLFLKRKHVFVFRRRIKWLKIIKYNKTF